MAVEQAFDHRFVAGLALREKQSQQNYRPYIAVHKWFARRAGSLFRALLLAEFANGPLKETYFASNALSGIRIGDPFMGGGTSLIEANRLGCNIVGYDINPMAHWIVEEELRSIDLSAYQRETTRLMTTLEKKVGYLYRTRCSRCGSEDARAKYFLWVKTQSCTKCGGTFDLFPRYLLAENWRHPAYVLVCPGCGALAEVKHKRKPGACPSCGASLSVAGPASRNGCSCPHCGTLNPYPRYPQTSLQDRMFAIEYHCPPCRKTHKGRFFKTPDEDDLLKYQSAVVRWSRMKPLFVPGDRVLPGSETRRLRRFGYRRYQDMFNGRQLLGLELSARAIHRCRDERVRRALITNFSDLLRYQTMLCRYDTKALKSIDIFGMHAFPVHLTQCESNLLGIGRGANNAVVGSGGWLNIVRKYIRAKTYCDAPFERRPDGERTIRVYVDERIGQSGPGGKERQVALYSQDSGAAEIPGGQLDAVLTDPPYFGNVQYAQLMDFCAAWVAMLDDRFCDRRESFLKELTLELSGNVGEPQALEEYTSGLSRVFRRFARALKTNGLFACTFHHSKPEVYAALLVALLNAGLRCTACFPCPSEMHGSFHIHGQNASRTDMVFVCRKRGSHWRAYRPPVERTIERQEADLAAAGLRLTGADRECIRLGLEACRAAAVLETRWSSTRSTSRSLEIAVDALNKVRRMKG